MAPLPRPFDEDMAFQYRNWRAERVGWIVMAVLVLAALAGLFGAGPLSHARITDGTGAIAVDYQRFARLSSPFNLTVDLSPAATATGEAALVLDRTFLRELRLGAIDPQPAAAVAVPEGFRLHVRVEPGAAVRLRLRVHADRIGRATPSLGLAGQAPLRPAIFVFP